MPIERNQTVFEPDRPNVVDGSMDEPEVKQYSLTFYRVDQDAGRPQEKRLFALLGSFDGKTIKELIALHGRRYDYFICHDSYDGCLLVGTPKSNSDEVNRFPCKIHGWDK